MLDVNDKIEFMGGECFNRAVADITECVDSAAFLFMFNNKLLIKKKLFRSTKKNFKIALGMMRRKIKR